MIKNRNLLGNAILALKKLCTVLFDTGKLKITMKRHAACFMDQEYTCNSCRTACAPQNFRLQAADCIRLA